MSWLVLGFCAAQAAGCAGEPGDSPDVDVSAEGAAAHAGPTAPLLELHAAHPEMSEGRFPVQWEGREFFLDSVPIITQADFRQVQALRREGGVMVLFELDASGAERLRAATAENLGGHIAQTFRGGVVAIPVVRDEISGGRGQFWIPTVSQDESTQIVAELDSILPSSP